MRLLDSRISAAWALSFGFAISTALLTATCTNDFANLASEQGGSGGGPTDASSSAASSGAGSLDAASSGATGTGDGGQSTLPCVEGEPPMGTAATPPSTAFSKYCSAANGCQSNSTLACNVCGASCDDFSCTGPQCELWCSLGTSCRNETCKGDRCAFYCDGCKGQLQGSAPDISPVKCSGGATCDFAFKAGTQNTVQIDCSGSSKCTIATQAKNTVVKCMNNSTCDVRCENNSCSISLTCDATSTCIVHCDTAAPGCALQCGGAAISNCGAAGATCNLAPPCVLN